MIKRFESRINDVHNHQVALETEVGRHGDRLDHLEANVDGIKAEAVSAAIAAVKQIGSGSRFQAGKIEVRGACQYADVDTKGFAREFATEMVATLRTLLPVKLQGQISEFALRGLCSAGVRGYIIEVPVLDSNHVEEIRGIVGKKLRVTPTLKFNDETLYCVLEKSEDDKLRYKHMGKLKELVTRQRAALGVNAVGELKISWRPQFEVRYVDSDELVAHVAPNGIVEPVDAACLKYLGLAAREVRRAVAGTV